MDIRVAVCLRRDGSAQSCQAIKVLGSFRKTIVPIELNDAFETLPGRLRVSSDLIKCGEEAEDRRLLRPAAELDVMFRRVIETTLGSYEIMMIQESFSDMGVGEGQTFFIPDDAVGVERSSERFNGLLPPTFPRLLHRQIMVENSERAIVAELTQDIQGFEKVGPGLGRAIGSDVEISQIDQGVGDRMTVPFRPLQFKNFPIATFSLVEVLQKRAGIAEIAQGVGKTRRVAA